MKKMVHIKCQTGQSKYSDKHVDYMYGVADNIGLYAETTRDQTNEWGTYENLKTIILNQAVKFGIPTVYLLFWDERI